MIRPGSARGAGATTAISVGQFAAGSLPSVCVLTGQPATSLAPRSARAPRERTGGAMLLLVVGAFFGVFSVREVRGHLPYNATMARNDPTYRDRRRRLAIRGLALGLPGIALWLLAINEVVGVELAGFFVGLVGMLLTIASVVALSLAARRPITWLRLTYDEQRTGLVLIHDAHPDFVAALSMPAGPAIGSFGNWLTDDGHEASAS